MQVKQYLSDEREVSRLAGPAASVGGVGTSNLIPSMPPNIQHTWVQTNRRHRVDTVRRAIHALDAQRVLVFMNFQSRLQVCCLHGYLADNGLSDGIGFPSSLPILLALC